jgi:hypothetical protein
MKAAFNGRGRNLGILDDRWLGACLKNVAGWSITIETDGVSIYLV